MKLERVQKIIAKAGISSRREAEKLINLQKVTINGKIAQLGAKVSPKDKILVNNKPIYEQHKVYYLMNKPQKTLSTLKKQDDRTIISDLIKEKKYLFPVGRLDYNTTGTIILTNDGELAYRLTHPKYEVLRTYKVKVDNELTPNQLKKLNNQKVYIDQILSWQKITLLTPRTYLVTLKQGINHHVKKLFKLFNINVIKLSRISFANLSHVNNLKQGEYRLLKPHEIKKLKLLVNILN